MNFIKFDRKEKENGFIGNVSFGARTQIIRLKQNELQMVKLR